MMLSPHVVISEIKELKDKGVLVDDSITKNLEKRGPWPHLYSLSTIAKLVGKNVGYENIRIEPENRDTGRDTGDVDLLITSDMSRYSIQHRFSQAL